MDHKQCQSPRADRISKVHHTECWHLLTGHPASLVLLLATIQYSEITMQPGLRAQDKRTQETAQKAVRLRQMAQKKRGSTTTKTWHIYKPKSQ